MIKNIALFLLASLVLTLRPVSAQNNGSATISSAADWLTALPVPDRSLSFSVSDSGEYKPIIWGLDLAWLSEGNIKRGMAFMGAERIDLIRSSFTPTAPLDDGQLQATELGRLNERLNIIALLGRPMQLVLNCDHPVVDPWFSGNAARWAQLIDVTAKLHEKSGHRVLTVSPFNEPDFSATGQGSITDFYNIAGELRKNPHFDSIRISGGNTLNTDQALPWYNQLKARLDEGNTHQLAGSFDNYAAFFQTVRANGHHATNDELHNVMEAMVGVEYGMQTGIWWGTAERTRSEFVKASDGRRLAYSEHRPNWTAASVYRHPEGKIQGFVGSSERQAVNTSFRFVSKERDVYFDGHGPQREYIMNIPGGTGYQQGQTNAEGLVNITWGDDIQPVIDGQYILVNRNSSKIMEVAGGSATAGANVRQNSYKNANYQQWYVKPVSTRIGGDYSYYTITAVHSGKALDIMNWSLDAGGNLIVWDDAKGANQQWYLDYIEDGWFNIRSRHSSLCIEVANASAVSGANIQQGAPADAYSQQWRLIPAGAAVEFDAPDVPKNLQASANAESIALQWQKSSASDVAGYTIYRSKKSGGPWETIARQVNTTAFVDNTCISGEPFFYRIKAVDHSLNHSDWSNEVIAKAGKTNALVAHLTFDETTRDSSVNLNHSAAFGSISYVEGKTGSGAVSLRGTSAFLQLPATVASHQELTIACWVYWRGGGNWQRIFDFGNNQDEYLFLTPKSESGELRFAIKNGGEEQTLNTTALPARQWTHVAVSFSESKVGLYVNGMLADESENISIRPSDFNPIHNYLGRSQYPDPLFNGYLDDFRLYNHALEADELMQLMQLTSDVNQLSPVVASLSLWPLPANDVINVSYHSPTIQKGHSKLRLFNINGVLLLKEVIKNGQTMQLETAHLPSGTYLLQLSSKRETFVKKLIIKR
ncbi:LamG-like jellyroll fold domain-containing protein [Roseimarinus sediminis]|uniref:LamG-like jellyroll fold domain-containing protein n=1 Tax=Roseimarinus sediminis TaxID=1610899 RepID=UPI003D19804F